MNEGLNKTAIIIQGFDALDVTKNIARMTKRHQASLLSNLEEIMDRRSYEYEMVRKAILDATNDFSRDVVKSIFGDITY